MRKEKENLDVLLNDKVAASNNYDKTVKKIKFDTNVASETFQKIRSIKIQVEPTMIKRDMPLVLWFYGKTIIWHYLFDLFHTRKDLLDVVHFLQL